MLLLIALNGESVVMEVQPYITHFPCINCMKILCASGIQNIYYIHDYNNDNLVYYFKGLSKINEFKKI